jgi:hypothetical protein
MSSIAAITYDGAVAVTKSDTVPDPNGGSSGFAGLWIVTAGNISFQDSIGNSVGTTGSPLAVVVGFIPIRCVRVNNTGTTAVAYGLRAVP